MPPRAPIEALPRSILLVGAGKMGTAMLQGWLALGLEGHKITLLEPSPSPELLALATGHGCGFTPSSTPAEVMVLAIKPQTLDLAAETLAPLATPETLVVSILAGKTIADLAARLPNALGHIRAMPNLPAAVGRGITAMTAGTSVGAIERTKAAALLSAIGEVLWLHDENLIDSATAVSGSGPAYIFHLVETLAVAGQKAGLDEATAMQLARATLIGSAALLEQHPQQTATQLRESVTSKGGTTAAALDILMGPDGLRPLMEKTVLAAYARAKALSG